MSPTSCVPWGKLLNLSGPQFPQLWKMENNSTCYRGRLAEINILIFMECLPRSNNKWRLLCLLTLPPPIPSPSLLYDCVRAQLLSHVWLFASPWTGTRQAHLSMGFPSKNTRVGCCFLLQGIFLTQGSNHISFVSCIVVPRFFSPVWLFSTLWNVACQAPLSMGFLRHEYWSGLPFPSPGDLPDPGTEP